MGQLEKLKARMATIPKDFSWIECQKLLKSLGYQETQAGKTSGSRVRFIHADFAPITLHKPHPKPILKRYQIKQMITTLEERGQL
jgi:hypothetical protein